MQFKIVEKSNPHAVHAICDTLQGAQRWLDVLAPEYCRRGFFMNKTLTPNSFEIKQVKD